MEKEQSPQWEDLRVPNRPKILRVLAWVSVLSLIICWGGTALLFFGKNFPASNYVLPISFLSAFVAGLSSFERMGGIVAALATLTLIAVLCYGMGGASC